MDNTYKARGTHYIDGHWVTGSGSPFTSDNPSTTETLWRGTHATPPEVAAAYEAAKHSLKCWASLSLDARATHLKAFAETIERHADVLTQLISCETGKPRWEAATETAAVIQKVNLSLEAYQARTKATTTPVEDYQAALRYKPHGVVAVLGAFNFPAHLSNGHIVPALLAGNTIVYKASEHTPLVAEFITQCWHDAGLPPGVFNLVQGNAETAHALVEMKVNAVCFTGSYQAGIALHQQLSRRPEVLLALEMGGNNPLVVDSDIQNISAAVYNTLLSAFLTTGQRCTAARRLIIPRSKTGDIFLAQLVLATKNLNIGAPEDAPAPFMGPVIHKHQVLKLLNQQAHLTKLGATALLQMQALEENTGFITPGILDMSAVKTPPDEEVFGPLIQLYFYDDFEEALTLANQTQYGLSAGLLSDNKARYEQFYHAVKAGLINWNRPLTGASSALPFGGVGHSGNHRPSAFFAADYVAYPTASLEADTLNLPEHTLPGIHLKEQDT